MNARLVKSALAGIFAMTLLAGSPVRADHGHEEVRRLQESGKILPLEDILKEAHWQRYRRLLEADLNRHQGRYYYELELLDERGVVWRKRFDATSGELVNHGRK